MNTEVFDIKKSGEVIYLKYKCFSDVNFINHAISTRYGGVSTLPGLETMNLGTQTRDSVQNVHENYRIFCEAAGFTADNVVISKQTHSLNVRVATCDDRGKGYLLERDYDNVDALVTNCRNLPLVIHSADCIPVSFVDLKHRAIGVAHCGWRGTYGRLAKNTLETMEKEFSTQTEDVLCTIGPGICKDCYEVSEDLYNDFVNRFGRWESFEFSDGHYYIDLVSTNALILQECGISQTSIIRSDICTCCNTDYLYSHRGQGPQRGIFATFMELV